jgi:polysaccharide biosynthesis protein PslH
MVDSVPSPGNSGAAVLYLCQKNPWTLSGGALIRNAWIIRTLAQRYAVDLVTADDERFPPGTFAALCRSIRQFPRAMGRVAQISRGLSALRPGAALLTSGTVTRDCRDYVRRVLETKTYAAVMFDLQMLDALPDRLENLIYHAHNCEYRLFRRRAGIEPVWLRSLLMFDAERLKRLERSVIERAGLIVACSEADVADLNDLNPSAAAKAIVAPNGVDVASYADVRATPSQDATVLITGSFDWRPNLLGAQWFLERVMPELERLAGTKRVCVRVAGRMQSHVRTGLAQRRNVVAIANPAAMQSELALATVVAVPVLASSGTRLRLLEAWAAGRPVVATTPGAFGLRYTEGRDLLVEDNPQCFARALWRLLSEPETRARLGAAGLERARAYDWPGICGRLAEELGSRLG